MMTSKDYLINFVSDVAIRLLITWILLLIQPFEPFGYVLSYWEFFFLAWGVKLINLKLKTIKVPK